MKHRILAVDDDISNLKATEALLEEWGYWVDAVSNGPEAIAVIEKKDRDYSVILLDYQMPGMNGAEAASKIRALSKESIIIIYSCDSSRRALKEVFRVGAVDFIDKDENVENLKAALEMACNRYENHIQLYRARVNKSHNAEILRSVGMIGHSQKMADVVQQCINYRKYNQPVLILGETGSGKELVAKAIQGDSHKKFQAVNCAAFTESNLIESELFGYEKGAFTGANNRKIGILESTGDGTVFLDELHYLNPKAQGLLLRALREKVIRRVGSNIETSISCRIFAASKPDLFKRVQAGEFLPDLYYRLKFLTIEVPALRERPEDIGLLVDHFCHKFYKETGRKISFRARTMRMMERYDWHGNVGELEGYVWQLLINAKESIISPSNLDERFQLLDILGDPNATLEALELKHEQEIRDLIALALSASGSKRKAAERLKVNESSLRHLIARLGVRESTV